MAWRETDGGGAGVEAGGQSEGRLSRYLRPINVWALSFGCILGWGAFVMPGTTFLPTAGPLGTAIAMALAAIIIGVIAANFHYMAQEYPDSGGAFAFTKHIFGHDHAFLCAWAIILAYLSIMWANATAFSLIIRYLFGPVFQVGYLYQVAGYDVYLGEVLLTLTVLMVFGFIGCGLKRLMNALNTVLALVLLIGTAVCLVCAVTGIQPGAASFQPDFAPSGNAGMAVFSIVALAPWAFIGFESVSNGAGEFSFPQRRLLAILIAAIASGAFVYIAMTYIAVMGTPEAYGSWPAYIADLGSLSGLEGLPTFHAMGMAMGHTGLALLAIVVLAAISTSMLGLYRASSRLLYALAQEEVLPPVFARLSPDGIPRNAIFLILALSVVVPFVGRAAIGWIVDVTTVSAAIVYGYTSACSFVMARRMGSRVFMVTGVLGVAMAVVFLVFPLMPNIWTVSALARESYFILAAWSILGLVMFRIVFQRDRRNRFGKSTIVWIFMLFLIFFASTMWMRLVTHTTTEEIVADVSEYYSQEYQDHHVSLSESDLQEEEQHLEGKTGEVRQMLLDNSMVQMGLIVISLLLMFSIYGLMLKRNKKLDVQRIEAEETSRAKTTFLSNMSHDIRTPMNAIIGYTHLAQRPGTTLEEAQEYLAKIDSSSQHLRGLINDVLEMSSIESGKMELELSEADLRKLVNDAYDMFSIPMQEKGVAFTSDADGVIDNWVVCDAVRLDRVLLNLVSNAYKFTPAGGEVAVVLKQLGPAEDGRADYELRVRDTGIGMAPEFAEHVFEAFERERAATKSGIQGTGLGMAITKSIVDMMEGSISVETAPGEGTEFTVRVSFPVVEGAGADEPLPDAGSPADGAAAPDFSGLRALVVEDNEINFEIASLVLQDMGFAVEGAENGQVGLDKVAASEPGYYDVVIMDVRMPVMDGLEATRRIRALSDPVLAGIPIVGAGANAFAEDIRENREAGMNAFVPKPLDIGDLQATLAEVLCG